MKLLSNLLVLGAFLWLLAAFWISNGGDPIWIWMGLLPAVFIAMVTLLRE